MNVDQELEIPPELNYITDAGRAVAAKKYGEALSILKEGLRKNSGVAETIDTEMFIALLRALLVEIEVNAGNHLGLSSHMRDVKKP